MDDNEAVLTQLCKELIEATREAKTLDATIKDLRFLVTLHMKEANVTEWEMPEAVVQNIPPSSHMGYSSKMIGDILPKVIEALLDADKTDMVKEITKCYITSHKSGYIRVKFTEEAE